MRQLLLYMILTIAMAAGATSAQEAPGTQEAERQRAQGLMSMWNPQVMIDQSVKQAKQRYKLTPEQEQLVRKMTSEGVTAFLDKHESEVRDLVKDFIQARLAGSPPTPVRVQEWSRRVVPLFEEGKQEILKGNRQFREVLTDEQKKLFDEDQKVLQQQITMSQERLTRWTEGQFNPETDWMNPSGRQRPGATRPVQPELDRWDLYVRGFINRFKLDAAQTGQAMSILTESKNRATEYYFSRKADIEAANARIREVVADPARREQVPTARKELEDLNQPVDNLYAEMQERLNQIPTEEQRKANEVEQQARRERWRERMRRTGGDTVVSATSQTQPSASQSAAEGDSASQPAVGGRIPTTRPKRIHGPSASQPASQPATSQP